MSLYEKTVYPLSRCTKWEEYCGQGRRTALNQENPTVKWHLINRISLASKSETFC